MNSNEKVPKGKGLRWKLIERLKIDSGYYAFERTNKMAD
jgi:hypothetical protein